MAREAEGNGIVVGEVQDEEQEAAAHLLDPSYNRRTASVTDGVIGLPVDGAATEEFVGKAYLMGHSESVDDNQNE